MIPKTIHFIWIGQKPKYLNYVLQAYRECNPECIINLIYYSNLQLENLYFKKNIQSELDQYIFNLLDNIIYYNQYSDLIKVLLLGKSKSQINHSYTPFIQLFCDILRLDILNIYGGIYVDCDTFPIRPFDESIFNHDKFCVYDKIDDLVFPNNYFIGLRKNLSWDNYFDDSGYKFIQTNNYQHFPKFKQTKSLDFRIRRIKFFKCCLKKEDFKDINTANYFEHYSEFRWGNNKIDATKFDNVFDKKKYY